MFRFLSNLLIFAAAAICYGQSSISNPPSTGTGGVSTISCASSPGNTHGAYRQQCQTNVGLLFVCNNVSACTVAADWVAVPSSVDWGVLINIPNTINNWDTTKTASTDATMGGGSPSATLVPTQDAVNTYVTNAVAGVAITVPFAATNTSANQPAMQLQAHTGCSGPIFQLNASDSTSIFAIDCATGQITSGLASAQSETTIHGASQTAVWGFKGNNSRAADFHAIVPSADPTAGQVMTYGVKDGSNNSAVSWANKLTTPSGSGFPSVSSGGDAPTNRAMTGTAGQIAIANGDGTGGAPTFTLDFTNATNKATPVSADKIPIYDVAGTAYKYVTVGSLPATTPVLTFSNTPSNLRYYGDGSDGALSTSSGTTSLSGEHWYSSVSVTGSAIIKANVANSPVIIRSTGTCTFGNGATISASPNTSGVPGTTGNGFIGSSGGGGGGGAGAGASSVVSLNGFSVLTAAAGGSSGGAGGAGAQIAATIWKAMTEVSNFFGPGGATGGNGGSTGGAGGSGGGLVVIVCPTIDLQSGFTIDVSGQNGTDSSSNSKGAGGGGGGGAIITAAQTYTNYAATLTTTGGSAGGCAAFTTCGAGGAGGAGRSIQFTIN